MKRSLTALILVLVLALTCAGCGAPATQTPVLPTQSGAALTDPAPNGAQATEDTLPPSAPEAGTDVPASVDAEGDSVELPSENESDSVSDAPDRAALTCTLSISCAALLAHMDALNSEKAELVPADGVLLATSEQGFEAGESVFDLLRRVCREEKIHMEFSTSPLYGSAYIEGIGNLYEFDCGEGSGWMYRVNGEFPRYGCSQYTLSAGDTVEWVYTCDFGADVGGEEASE